ncbi:MAG: Asp-tRNA(Asn)/Glu-tRNA(Gln) amidotransferase subunit GatC [Endomicrobiia bacterium]
MITKKDVEYVANLARLKLSEEEKEKFTKQLGTILDYMDKLKKLNTENVKPTSHVLELKNVWREDELKPCFYSDNLLENAPEKEADFFKVKKVIE